MKCVFSCTKTALSAIDESSQRALLSGYIAKPAAEEIRSNGALVAGIASVMRASIVNLWYDYVYVYQQANKYVVERDGETFKLLHLFHPLALNWQVSQEGLAHSILFHGTGWAVASTSAAALPKCSPWPASLKPTQLLISDSNSTSNGELHLGWMQWLFRHQANYMSSCHEFFA